MLDLNSENPYVHLIKGQHIHYVDHIELECGDTLHDVPLAYKTWGKLNPEGTNCMVVCHALSGSADVADWWGALLGDGRALDPSRFFIVCANALGSPYGTCSPVTINPDTGERWGPEFPLTTIKDDCRIQRMLLEHLGVKQVAVVIGGSMGGMLAQEYLFMGAEFVRSGVLLATSAYHSAWGISWGEAQRQSIYCDPKYMDGYYPLNDPPIAGLGAARMSALLTYRSRNSFDHKFGRHEPDPTKHKGSDEMNTQNLSPGEENRAIHNHGSISGSIGSRRSSSSSMASLQGYRKKKHGNAQTYFTAQSYLRYQAQKFTDRFDANCYVAITRKLDTHDVSRNRTSSVGEALSLIKQPVMVIGIFSDALFTFEEQVEIHKSIKSSILKEIQSPEGHDAFLLEFGLINTYIQDFLLENVPEIMTGLTKQPIGEATDSVFGESEVTTW